MPLIQIGHQTRRIIIYQYNVMASQKPNCMCVLCTMCRTSHVQDQPPVFFTSDLILPQAGDPAAHPGW